MCYYTTNHLNVYSTPLSIYTWQLLQYLLTIYIMHVTTILFTIRSYTTIQLLSYATTVGPHNSNSDNSKSPLIRRNIHFPWSALLQIFTSLIRTIFLSSWHFELTASNCTTLPSKCQCYAALILPLSIPCSLLPYYMYHLFINVPCIVNTIYNCTTQLPYQNYHPIIYTMQILYVTSSQNITEPQPRTFFKKF